MATGHYRNATINDTMSEEIVITGTVEFIWHTGDDGERMLVNFEADTSGHPNAFEIVGNLRDEIVDDLIEGSRIELCYTADHHEVIDLGSATTRDSIRPQITAIKILS